MGAWLGGWEGGWVGRWGGGRDDGLRGPRFCLHGVGWWPRVEHVTWYPTRNLLGNSSLPHRPLHSRSEITPNPSIPGAMLEQFSLVGLQFQPNLAHTSPILTQRRPKLTIFCRTTERNNSGPNGPSLGQAWANSGRPDHSKLASRSDFRVILGRPSRGNGGGEQLSSPYSPPPPPSLEV